MPCVERYMTIEPCSIADTDSLSRARELMCERLIRHLPVVDAEGHLVGIISDRDVDVIAAIPDVDLVRVEVARVMAPPLYVLTDAPIDEVSTLMAESKRDCVVVRGSHGMVGIFTATDALDALADLARRATA
ncbi:MAG: CBS domain-containing protein [Kofleriaceae bacterium]